MDDILLLGLSLLHIIILIIMILKTRSWFKKLDNHVKQMEIHYKYIQGGRKE